MLIWGCGFFICLFAQGDNQTPQKKTVEPVAKLHKILKFRLAPLDNEDGVTKTTNL